MKQFLSALLGLRRPRGKGLRIKAGLPAGYPGAKLARKALRHQVGLRWITRQSG